MTNRGRDAAVDWASRWGTLIAVAFWSAVGFAVYIDSVDILLWLFAALVPICLGPYFVGLVLDMCSTLRAESPKAPPLGETDVPILVGTLHVLMENADEKTWAELQRRFGEDALTAVVRDLEDAELRELIARRGHMA